MHLFEIKLLLLFKLFLLSEFLKFFLIILQISSVLFPFPYKSEVLEGFHLITLPFSKIDSNFTLSALQFHTLESVSLPSCLLPTLMDILLKYGTSIIPLLELPITNLELCIAE